MTDHKGTATDFDPNVGECSLCELAALQSSARGSRFWRCLRADSDERFLRYPPLPVVSCSGYSPRMEVSEPPPEKTRS